MDVDTIALAFRCSTARARDAHDGINAALVAAECTTVRRCAMFAAQVGHETLGLFYDGEVWGPTTAQKRYDPASGSSLARDLGNTVVGDGYRYRGRGRIQLTGKANYRAFSGWCQSRGMVPAGDYFVTNPDLVASSPWRELAASWYWTVARTGINPAADRGDVREVTRLINGGANGLADRQNRYDGALKLDGRLLPARAAGGTSTPGGDWFDMATEADLRRVIEQVVPTAVWHHPIPDYYGPDLPPQGAYAILAWAAAHAAHARNGAAEVAALRTELRAALSQRLPAAATGGGALSAVDVEDLVDAVIEALARTPLTLAPASAVANTPR